MSQEPMNWGKTLEITVPVFGLDASDVRRLERQRRAIRKRAETRWPGNPQRQSQAIRDLFGRRFEQLGLLRPNDVTLAGILWVDPVERVIVTTDPVLIDMGEPLAWTIQADWDEVTDLETLGEVIRCAGHPRLQFSGRRSVTDRIHWDAVVSNTSTMFTPEVVPEEPPKYSLNQLRTVFDRSTRGSDEDVLAEARHELSKFPNRGPLAGYTRGELDTMSRRARMDEDVGLLQDIQDELDVRAEIAEEHKRKLAEERGRTGKR
jgi:hypothetical protein